MNIPTRKLTAREFYDSDPYGFSACAFGATSTTNRRLGARTPLTTKKGLTMNKRLLGRTGLQVSEICLGTMNFGWTTDHSTSLRLLNQFVDAGGNFIQAASLVPTGVMEAGSASSSETLLGDWMKSRQVSRGNVVLATQLASPLSATNRIATAKTLEQACDASLRRMGTDYLDLVICQWSPDTVMDELLRAMTLLVQRGKVRYFGLTGCRPWRAAESFGRAARNVWCRIEALQADYSLLERALSTRDLLDMSCEHRVGFVARSPLAGGFLASPKIAHHAGLSERSRWLHSRYCNTRSDAVIRELAEVAGEQRVQPASVALAWVLSNRCVSAALVGAQSTLHLDDAITACTLALSQSQVDRLCTAAEPASQSRMNRSHAARTRRRPVLREGAETSLEYGSRRCHRFGRENRP